MKVKVDQAPRSSPWHVGTLIDPYYSHAAHRERPAGLWATGLDLYILEMTARIIVSRMFASCARDQTIRPPTPSCRSTPKQSSFPHQDKTSSFLMSLWTILKTTKWS